MRKKCIHVLSIPIFFLLMYIRYTPTPFGYDCKNSVMNSVPLSGDFSAASEINSSYANARHFLLTSGMITYLTLEIDSSTIMLTMSGHVSDFHLFREKRKILRNREEKDARQQKAHLLSSCPFSFEFCRKELVFASVL